MNTNDPDYIVYDHPVAKVHIPTGIDIEASIETYTVTKSQVGWRLDEFVHAQEELMPMAAVRRAIEVGHVKVNGHLRSSGWRVRLHDQVVTMLAAHRHRTLVAEANTLAVLYTDPDFLVVNKPAMMLSHPTPKERTGTLINSLLHYLREQGEKNPRPALVHRLDRETSGVVLIARHPAAMGPLGKQFQERQVEKRYQAMVFGEPPSRGQIDAPIGHFPALWPRWRVAEKDGKPAQSSYTVLQQRAGFAQVDLKPHTGRTHQLRIHMSHIGHPLAGDHTYGRELNKTWQDQHKNFKISRHLLHAASLTFTHPRTGQLLTVTAPLPPDFLAFWDYLASKSVGDQLND
jgi:23S rRNA pseudouridine1911/1915/1917 synthase